MVAITVLLAATAASFFVGIQEDALGAGPPAVSLGHHLDADGGSHDLTLRHTGGDTVSAETLRIVVNGARCTGSFDPNNRYTPAALANPDSAIAAGSTFELSKRTLCRGGQLDLSAARVSATWIDTDGKSSHTLWRWKGPDA